MLPWEESKIEKKIMELEALITERFVDEEKKKKEQELDSKISALVFSSGGNRDREHIVKTWLDYQTDIKKGNESLVKYAKLTKKQLASYGIKEDELDKLYKEKLKIEEEFEKEPQKKKIKERVEDIKKMLEIILNSLEKSEEKVKELRGLVKESDEQFKNILGNRENLEKIINIVESFQIKRTIKKFLETKKNFLFSLEEVIEELGGCCNKLNDMKSEKRKLIIKAVSDIGESVSLSVMVNPIKLVVGVIDVVNSCYEMNLKDKRSEEFKKHLESEEEIFSFNETYNELKYIHRIYESGKSKISSEVVNILKLEFEIESANTKAFKPFNIKYNSICKFFNSWRPRSWNIDNMAEEIKSLGEILNEIKQELKGEEVLIEELFKNEQIKAQIEIPPK